MPMRAAKPTILGNFALRADPESLSDSDDGDFIRHSAMTKICRAEATHVTGRK